VDLSKFQKYAEDVVNGKIKSGRLLKLACQRYLSWFNMDDRYFDAELAEKPVKFISKLKFWEGAQFKGKPFILQDWQKFMLYAIFGWRWKSNNKRVIRHAYIQIARKCGKTSLTAALGLYGLIADGEQGAEVDIVAPSAEQSRIGFKHASNLAETINKHNILKIQRGLIEFPHSKSRFRIMSSDAKFGDGFNPTIGIIDEYHAFPNNDIPNLLTSGMGMRENPLMIYITTAGFNLFGPCKEYRDMCVEILNGNKSDDSIFPLIYEMDDDDDWTSEENWEKCCPALHNTVNVDFMRDQLNKAKNNPIDENDIKTKTFNLWCAGESAWIEGELIKKSSEKFDLEDLKVDGKMPNDIYCYAAVDLAADDDFTSLSLCIPRQDKLWFKTYLFVPSESLKTSKLKQLYKKWQQHNNIIVCEGNVQDYDIILNKLLEIRKQIPILKIGYDKWNSTAFVTNAEYQGLPMESFYQSAGHYNRPLKEMYRLFRCNKIRLDDNEAVRWCFNNVAIKEDNHENKMPKKKGKKHEKIDAVMSMLMSFGLMLEDPYCKANYIVEGDRNLYQMA